MPSFFKSINRLYLDIKVSFIRFFGIQLINNYYSSKKIDPKTDIESQLILTSNDDS